MKGKKIASSAKLTTFCYTTKTNTIKHRKCFVNVFNKAISSVADNRIFFNPLF